MRYFKRSLVPIYAKLTKLISRKYKKVKIQKILIIDNWRIGDLMMNIQAVASIHKSIKIDIISNESCVDFLKYLDIFDNIWGINNPIIHNESLFSYIKKMNKMPRNYDCIIDINGGDLSHLILRLMGFKKIVGDGQRGALFLNYIVPVMPYPCHIVDNIHNIYRELLNGVSPLSKNVYPIKGCRSVPKQKKAVIYLEASNINRVISGVDAEKIAEILIKNNYIVTIYTVEERKNYLSKHFINKPVKIKCASILEIYKDLLQVACVVASDSMLGHLAALAGVEKIITIYTDNIPENCSPFSKNIESIVLCNYRIKGQILNISPHKNIISKSDYRDICEYTSS